MAVDGLKEHVELGTRRPKDTWVEKQEERRLVGEVRFVSIVGRISVHIACRSTDNRSAWKGEDASGSTWMSLSCMYDFRFAFCHQANDVQSMVKDCS